MKFIHAADLHIESPYKGIRSLNQELGDALLKKGYQAYSNLIDACIHHQTDFLIIAGDSFDSDSGSLSAQYSFFKGLERLDTHGIQVYIICGNHDPLNQWAKNYSLPKNVVLFQGNEVQQQVFIKNGQPLASIYGVSYAEREENRRLVSQFSNSGDTPFSIGVLHGTFAGSSHPNPYCPFNMDELRATKMDYWALGHIHKREIVHENNPLVIYPGNLQGRHFNETGEKGCFLIEVDGSTIRSHEFISLSEVVFEYIQHDISSVNDIDGLFHVIDSIKNELLASQRSYMLRIEFTGMSELHQLLSDTIQVDDFLKKVNAEISYNLSFVYLDRIVNHTIPVIDLEERKQASDFVGDLLRRIEVYEKDTSLLAALQSEVYEELKSTKIGRFVQNTTDEATLNEVLNRAKWKCVAGLITNSDEA